ncbi:MAG: hypothetical protein ABW123_14330 [Cystobacter sp.]
MKKVLCGTGLVMLGVALTMMGCGGSIQEHEEEAATNGSAEADEQPSAANPEPSSQEAEDVNPGEVQNLAAYCYVLCSSGGWKGPFSSVNWGACTEYGKYYCANKGLAYKACKWASQKP